MGVSRHSVARHPSTVTATDRPRMGGAMTTPECLSPRTDVQYIAHHPINWPLVVPRRDRRARMGDAMTAPERLTLEACGGVARAAKD